MLTHPNTLPKNSTNVRLVECCPEDPGLGNPGASAPSAYPRHLEATLRLPDGRPVFLRPILPEDAAGLQAGFKRLTPHDVRMRFLQALPELSPSQAAYLTRIDYDRHMAMVAIGHDRNGDMDGWGVARLVADPQGARAEFAVVVRSDVQRQGIGSLLIDRLLAYAQDRGISQVWGDVLADNHAMLAFAEKRGFAVGLSPEGPGVLRISKALSRSTADAASESQRRGSCPS